MPAGKPGKAGLVRSALRRQLICDYVALNRALALELLARHDQLLEPSRADAHLPLRRGASRVRGSGARARNYRHHCDINHDKYADAMLMLLLVCMMMTLMLTPMVSVGLFALAGMFNR